MTAAVPLIKSSETSVYINKYMVWQPLQLFLGFSKGSCIGKDLSH